MKKIIKIFSVLAVAIIMLAGVSVVDAATSTSTSDTGKIRDTAVVDESEPGLLIDTGGPSFIRGDKFEGEIDPNFIPPQPSKDGQKKDFLLMVVAIVLLVLYTLVRTSGDKSTVSKWAAGILIAMFLLVVVFFAYVKIAGAWTPLSYTSCAVNGTVYSSWESLTEGTAASGFCTGGSGYSTGGSSNRPSSYSWKCTGWNGTGYVETASCSVSVSGSSGGGSTGAASCN